MNERKKIHKEISGWIKDLTGKWANPGRDADPETREKRKAQQQVLTFSLATILSNAQYHRSRAVIFFFGGPSSPGTPPSSSKLTWRSSVDGSGDSLPSRGASPTGVVAAASTVPGLVIWRGGNRARRVTNADKMYGWGGENGRSEVLGFISTWLESEGNGYQPRPCPLSL